MVNCVMFKCKFGDTEFSFICKIRKNKHETLGKNAAATAAVR